MFLLFILDYFILLLVATESILCKPSLPQWCNRDGKYYRADQEVTANYDPNTNTCSGLKCHNTGLIKPWKKKNCRTAEDRNKPYPDSPIIPVGCYEDGKYFPPGSRFGNVYRELYCYGKECSYFGKTLYWVKFNCKNPSSTAPTKILQ